MAVIHPRLRNNNPRRHSSRRSRHSGHSRNLRDPSSHRRRRGRTGAWSPWAWSWSALWSPGAWWSMLLLWLLLRSCRPATSRRCRSRRLTAWSKQPPPVVVARVVAVRVVGFVVVTGLAVVVLVAVIRGAAVVCGVAGSAALQAAIVTASSRANRQSRARFISHRLLCVNYSTARGKMQEGPRSESRKTDTVSEKAAAIFSRKSFVHP